MTNYVYKISARASFCASLKIVGSKGSCAKLHGYTYNVTVILQTSGLNNLGFAFDYDLLNKELTSLCQQVDYCYLNDHLLFEKLSPSCENIAMVFLNSLKSTLKLNDKQKLIIQINTKPGCVVEVSC